ncbi:AraC family transcriptional regulator [uncultured Vibrio sp.]|uniref:AraC family transcriptional regulator n=1 Tax=uncultured Vibrio sp. TaxID=114054 RepID=UPI0025FC1874|nr:AraC family transcriptional regulator [uncultured Vibrio sp.]
MHFIRAAGFMAGYHNALKEYQLNSEALKIPTSVFEHPMTLLPTCEFNDLLTRLEHLSQDPDYILNVSKKVALVNIGSVEKWMYSGHDLTSMIRRINSGISCLQSGAFVTGKQSGRITKWTYRSPSIGSSAKVHDSIRVAIFMVKAMKVYLGDQFTPIRVMLSGSRVNKHKYRDYFGCDIGWNHSQTEIWFNSELRLLPAQTVSNHKASLPINLRDLDDFLNMPQFEDEMKVVYETINYSCHYGYPTLKRVSNLMGLSEQQFQRKFAKQGYSFTTLCGYVLSNEAVNLFSRGYSIEDTYKRLGYRNVESFNRMFKKQRGLTPIQYVKRFQSGFH